MSDSTLPEVPRFDQGESAESGSDPAEMPATLQVPDRRHLVVVLTRAILPEDQAGSSAVLATRFWHPRDRRWSVNFFDSLDHALRLFVDESGWSLLQQQSLAGEHEHELIFRARREDFTGPTTEEMLEGVGLTPTDVRKLLEKDPPDSAR